MKKYLILFILFYSFTNFFAQSIHQKNIYFPSNHYALNEASINALDIIYEEVADFNDYSLQIIGHTDQDGSDDFNMKLSRKRAEEVKQYFLNKGISKTSINVSFLGESELAINALDEASKQQNRRVTIIAEGYKYETVTELISQLIPEHKEAFTIDQFVESNLNLSQGTEVNIPPNAFCYLDGSPIESGEVDLIFKEAYEYMDMIDERLYTQTEDEILETGGMIYIEANQNGKPLKLQEGKSIELILPSQEIKEGMELFTGSEDENGIIWQETSKPVTSVTSNKRKFELQPVEVDLSPILEFELKEKEYPNLNFGEMVSYPRAARKSYEPYEGNYSKEEYEEALRKYHAVMEIYEKDKIDRPVKLAHWGNEVSLRKIALFQHKENAGRAKLFNNLKENIERLEDKKDEICHKRLVEVLFKFLDNDLGRLKYDDRKQMLKTFGKGLGDVIKYDGFVMPNMDQRKGHQFFAEFRDSLKKVKYLILDNEREQRKAYLNQELESGVVSNVTVSRYLMNTDKLGWINCDKFYKLSEEEKMDLHYAKESFDSRYYLVFKNIKSVIRPSKVRESIVFKGIPKGEEVRLVAIKVRDGKASLAKQDFTLGSDVDVDLTFATVEMKTLRKALTDM